ncbi:MAG TPA: pantoate--beta-alanine ligase [Actinomycetota bacterium]|nr:pantoate--beta-alanine ligase [Actinomycetota bacterium]
MKFFDTIPALRQALEGARRSGRTVEFVPTMGALHEGHLALVGAARQAGGLSVMSIFVNPLQFGPSEDFDSYPRDLDGDLAAAEQAGVDVVFAPTAAEMYPAGQMQTRVEVGRLGEILEGAYRPGHFAGVATVCAKLFHIVGPDRVYLGQKDAQQVAVLRQMVEDLNLPVELVSCPTVREPDGLALSSRNRRLGAEDRRAAPALYAGLQAAARAAEAGETSAARLVAAARQVVDLQPAVRLQYLEVVHPRTFEPVDEISQEALVAVAAHVGPVRLIDNCIVGTA